MEFNPNDMQKLSELLRPPSEETAAASSEAQGWGCASEDLPKTGYAISATMQRPVRGNEQKAPKSIEEFEEQINDELDQQTGMDDRKEPVYTMHYQQSVSAEDVYLQIGPKTPSSASCERLVVRVRLPGDKREHVQLDVQSALVSVRTPRHALRLPLPHAVNPDASRACWDPVERTLTLTLKLERELDFINF